MLREKVFLIGASGTIGSAASEAIYNSNYDITALIHHNSNEFLESNATLIKSSLTDTALIEKQLNKHDYLFISVNAGNNPTKIKNIEQKAIIDIIKIAKFTGIKKVIYISGMYAQKQFTNYPSENAKLKVEQALIESGLNFTVFKPGFLDITLQQFIQKNKIILLGEQPYPIHIVKLEKLASDIASSFKMSQTDNKIYVVTGREKPTLLIEALNKLSMTFNPPLSVKTKPLWFMKILNFLILKGKLGRAIDTMSLVQKYGEVGNTQPYHDTFKN